MISRRSIVHKTAGVAIGALTLVGQASAGSAHTGEQNRSIEDQHGRSVTTVTATGNQTAVRASRLPDGLVPLVNTLETRLETVSIDQCTGVTGRGTVSGGRLGSGSAAVMGPFEPDAVRRECRRRHSVVAGSRGQVERFVTDDGIAIAPIEGAIVLGYADGDTDVAVARLDRDVAGRARGSSRSVHPHGTSLASVLDGDAVATASLGASTRRRLRAALADTAGPLPAVVDAADEIGLAVTVESPTQTDVTYGVTADPDRLSTETVRSVLREANAGPETIDNVRLGRSGRTVLVDAEVPTHNAIRAHVDAIGLDASLDDRS